VPPPQNRRRAANEFLHDYNWVIISDTKRKLQQTHVFIIISVIIHAVKSLSFVLASIKKMYCDGSKSTTTKQKKSIKKLPAAKKSVSKHVNILKAAKKSPPLKKLQKNDQSVLKKTSPSLSHRDLCALFLLQA